MHNFVLFQLETDFMKHLRICLKLIHKYYPDNGQIILFKLFGTCSHFADLNRLLFYDW